MHTFLTTISGYGDATALSGSFKGLLGYAAPPTKRHLRHPVAALKAVQFKHSRNTVNALKIVNFKKERLRFNLHHD